MQDSAKLLGFDARRALNFDSSRELSIDLNRALQFDLDRDLSFDPARPLPFGKRGVLFRGYVCPVCGAAVLLDAKECDECGVAFASAPPEPKTPAKEPGRPLSQKAAERQPPKYGPTQTTARKQPQRQAARRPEAPGRAEAPQAPAQRPRTFQCPVCNTQVPTGSASCPKCTVQFVFEAPPPPEDALVLCPICDLRVSTKTDYCTRCGEPLSPGAIARHKRELEGMKANRVRTETGLSKVGEPQRKESTSHTITWEEYLEKKKGGGNR
jgi:predicted amidophosphoribosyltransferase